MSIFFDSAGDHNWYIGAYWGARAAEPNEAADRICQFGRQLKDLLELSDWQDAVGKRLGLSRTMLSRKLSSSINKRDTDGQVIPELGFRLYFAGVCGDRARSVIPITVAVGIATASLANRVILNLPGTVIHWIESRGLWSQVLRLSIATFDADNARVSCTEFSDAVDPNAPFVNWGWLTYRSKYLRQIQKVPQGVICQAFGDLGTLYSTSQAMCDSLSRASVMLARALDKQARRTNWTRD